MKKMFLPLLALPFLLMACGGGETEAVSSSSDDLETTLPVDTASSESKESFELASKDNGLSGPEETSLFAAAAEDDEYPPLAKISIAADDSWTYCTSVDEKKTGLLSSDESVVPMEALSLDTVLDSDLHGSSGSNEIVGFTIDLDRKLVKPGTARILFTTRPNNGSSSIFGDTRLCFEVEIAAYGSIEVETSTVDIALSTEGIEEALADMSYETLELCLSDTEAIYGSTALRTYQAPIGEDDLLRGSLEVNGLKLQTGHLYKIWIFAEDAEENRVWLAVKGEGKKATLTPNEGNLDSALVVTGDTSIACELA